MPLNFLATVFTEGTAGVPYWNEVSTYGPWLAGAALTKRYFGGASNTWERKMHGSVVLITGGTSGLGAQVAREVAKQGAQVILLTRNASNEWVYEYINDLREESGNNLIYAEECDLGDLHSVRKFATRWLDNSPPRRLDMVICCAGVALPPSAPRRATSDGIEEHLQINYMAHFHLLNLISPALRVQPPGRDVRVVLTTCIAAVMGEFSLDDLEFTSRGYPSYRPWKVLGASKLALTMFAYEFQKRLNTYERPDKMPMNAHITVVDPGMMRSPSFKRFASFGSILGLLIYALLYPIWFIFLRSSSQGAQSVLYAIMSPHPKDTLEVSYISDCKIRPPPPRSELRNEGLMKELYDQTEKFANDTEKKSIIAKKRFEKSENNDTKRKESVEEVPAASATGQPTKKKPTKRGAGKKK